LWLAYFLPKPSTNFHEFSNGKEQIRAFVVLFVDGFRRYHKFR